MKLNMDRQWEKMKHKAVLIENVNTIDKHKKKEIKFKLSISSRKEETSLYLYSKTLNDRKGMFNI